MCHVVYFWIPPLVDSGGSGLFYCRPFPFRWQRAQKVAVTARNIRGRREGSREDLLRAVRRRRRPRPGAVSQSVE